MNTNTEKIVGNNIKQLRKKKGFTQDSFSQQLQMRGCNLTRSSIAKIEAGQRHLYPDEIIIIKQVLNVKFEDFLNI